MKVPVLILCILVVQCYSIPIEKFSWPWKNAGESSQTSEAPVTKKHDATKPAENPDKQGVNPVMASRRRRQADVEDVPEEAAQYQQGYTQGTLAQHSETYPTQSTATQEHHQEHQQPQRQSAQSAPTQEHHQEHQQPQSQSAQSAPTQEHHQEHQQPQSQSAQSAPTQEHQQPQHQSAPTHEHHQEHQQPQRQSAQSAPTHEHHQEHQRPVQEPPKRQSSAAGHKDSELQSAWNPDAKSVNADDELRSALPNNQGGLFGPMMTMFNDVRNTFTALEHMRGMLHNVAVMTGVCQGH